MNTKPEKEIIPPFNNIHKEKWQKEIAHNITRIIPLKKDYMRITSNGFFRV